MRIGDNGLRYYRSRSSAHRAGKRASKRLKTMSYIIADLGNEYLLLTTDAEYKLVRAVQFDQRRICQYFTYNNLSEVVT